MVEYSTCTTAVGNVREQTGAAVFLVQDDTAAVHVYAGCFACTLSTH